MARKFSRVETHLVDPLVLKSEIGLVWKLNPTLYRYVRVGLFATSHYEREPPKTLLRERTLVGYTVGGVRTAFRTRARRMFYLLPGDPWEFDGCPSEGVDPTTVEAGKQGQRTARAEKYVRPKKVKAVPK